MAKIIKTWEKYFDEIKKPIEIKDQDKVLKILFKLRKKSEDIGLINIIENCSEIKFWDKIEILKILEKLKYDGIIFEPRINVYRFLGGE